MAGTSSAREGKADRRTYLPVRYTNIHQKQKEYKKMAVVMAGGRFIRHGNTGTGNLYGGKCVTRDGGIMSGSGADRNGSDRLGW